MFLKEAGRVDTGCDGHRRRSFRDVFSGCLEGSRGDRRRLRRHAHRDSAHHLYGRNLGSTVFALLGIGAVDTFTVGTIAILPEQLAGQASIFAVLTLVIFLNFPSSGGAIPVSFLPDFWQSLHSFWFGSGAMEAIGSIV